MRQAQLTHFDFIDPIIVQEIEPHIILLKSEIK